jgi:glutamine cyclotransferase
MQAELRETFLPGEQGGQRMKRILGLSLITIFLILISFAAISLFFPLDASKPISEAIPVYGYEIIASFPHDRHAFTEGLAYSDGILIEGTGLFGKSTVRTVNLETGEVIRVQNLSDEYFGEGVSVSGDKIYQLTEEARLGFMYNRETLEPEGRFPYPSAGWGLTTDGRSLIMSDGSALLYFLDPETFSRTRTIEVQAGGVPVRSLNELEYVNDQIYANIWPTDRIAMISPMTGEVLGWIDLDGILSPEGREEIGWSEIGGWDGNTSSSWACLNGIAYDPAGKRLFVTGKLWPSLYEIRLTAPDPAV